MPYKVGGVQRPSQPCLTQSLRKKLPAVTSNRQVVSSRPPGFNSRPAISRPSATLHRVVVRTDARLLLSCRPHPIPSLTGPTNWHQCSPYCTGGKLRRSKEANPLAQERSGAGMAAGLAKNDLSGHAGEGPGLSFGGRNSFFSFEIPSQSRAETRGKMHTRKGKNEKNRKWKVK
ncbi:hypothetical protein BDQ94DRAFT_143089 [Aspergillus welwitschiae]|uniref:Uncharacterized protein n=1 Tax=Aspergillus welwitschiae TaxID=1341132 RepID=A0A3F3Q2M0_9EURO|nr:hypothetical protein BDQ94DRAFT_143089 [Aspergillus welwitschiae]RDH33413.1 hypothetical protein BDQ94DRAFT_143089 [Aspergillus welwitschiae]